MFSFTICPICVLLGIGCFYLLGNALVQEARARKEPLNTKESDKRHEDKTAS